MIVRSPHLCGVETNDKIMGVPGAEAPGEVLSSIFCLVSGLREVIVQTTLRIAACPLSPFATSILLRSIGLISRISGL